MAASPTLPLPGDANDAVEEVGDSSGEPREVIPLTTGHTSGTSTAAHPRAPKLHRTSPVGMPLHYSSSSTALSRMSASEEEDEPQTPLAMSPALQASVAAWQSAASLLQELHSLQPLSLPCAQLPPHGTAQLAGQQLLLLTPEPQERAANPAWLHAAVAHQQAQHQLWVRGGCQEACSPDRQQAHLPPASEAPTATLHSTPPWS